MHHFEKKFALELIKLAVIHFMMKNLICQGRILINLILRKLKLQILKVNMKIFSSSSLVPRLGVQFDSRSFAAVF